jgi:hypothetical protein
LKGKAVARSQKELKGLLYNLRSVIDGFIKILDSGAMAPESIEDALCNTIAKELGPKQAPE